MNLNVITRSCGECTACCTACSVVELLKPLNTRCVHINEKGCAIYEQRPQSCRDFNCVWLQGGLPEKFRPDKSGFIFSHPTQPRRDQVTLECSVLNENFDMRQLQYLFDKLRANFRVPAHLIIYPASFRKPFDRSLFTVAKRLTPNIQIAVGYTSDAQAT